MSSSLRPLPFVRAYTLDFYGAKSCRVSNWMYDFGVVIIDKGFVGDLDGCLFLIWCRYGHGASLMAFGRLFVVLWKVLERGHSVGDWILW